MRILLDECVDQRLRLLFTGHDCQTAGYTKLSGLKNGALLTAAEPAGFEALVTTDQEIPYQQNLARLLSRDVQDAVRGALLPVSSYVHVQLSDRRAASRVASRRGSHMLRSVDAARDGAH
jgi:hypothetical protein